jgi:hypothetical protein
MFGKNTERLARSAVNVSRRRRDCRSTWLWYDIRTSFKIRGAQIPGASGSLVWNLLLVILLTPRILRWLLDSWKIYAPLFKSYC